VSPLNDIASLRVRATSDTVLPTLLSTRYQQHGSGVFFCSKINYCELKPIPYHMKEILNNDEVTYEQIDEAQVNKGR
jgi:hypothetical protein